VVYSHKPAWINICRIAKFSEIESSRTKWLWYHKAKIARRDITSHFDRLETIKKYIYIPKNRRINESTINWTCRWCATRIFTKTISGYCRRNGIEYEQTGWKVKFHWNHQLIYWPEMPEVIGGWLFVKNNGQPGLASLDYFAKQFWRANDER